MLKFLASCMVLFVIFVQYLQSYFEVVSQFEAIAMSMWSCGLFSASLEGKWVNVPKVSLSLSRRACDNCGWSRLSNNSFFSFSWYENQIGAPYRS